MKIPRILWILAVIVVSDLAPGVLRADCVDLGYFTDWVLENSRTITLYLGRRPLAIVTLSDCTVQPDSSIRLVQSYVCDSDKIKIDDETCSIITVQSSSTTYDP